MFVGFIFAAMYCVAVAALGMLGFDLLPCHICRERTDVTDAVGNTTVDVTESDSSSSLSEESERSRPSRL
ncbi:hypothetical protein Tco_0140696 [Tanacetum coccineum]